MKKKIFSLIMIMAAALSFCAVQGYSGTAVFAAADYGSSQLEIYARTVASEINRQRAAAGLAPIKLCDSLNGVALTRAKECAVTFDHIRPDGSLCFTALDEANVPYYTAGENIACGQTTPQAVMKAWMNSDEHRANILSADFEYVGVGVCYIGGTYYWTQFFTGGLPIEGEIAPYITQQPQNVKTPVGRSVKFEVKVQGSSLSYQWYFKKKGASDWSIWNDHTTSVTYGNSNAGWDGMQVFCKITDRKDMVLTSNAAVVTIVEAPVITAQPKNVTIAPGAVANFEIAAQGSGLKYQWYFKKAGASGWSIWNTHTSASTSGIANDSWNGMQVRCRVTDSKGIWTDSDAATVTLKPTVFITAQPKSVRTASGLSVNFEVKAAGSGLSYQWYYKKSGASNWSLWQKHTVSSISVTANDTWDGMKVYCRVTDSTGAFVNSDSATVTLVPEVSIVRSPDNAYTHAGRSVSFTVIAKGEGLKYQWYYKKAGASDWSVWSKHTQITVTGIADDSWNGMQMRCRVTDFAGRSVYSQPARIVFSSGISLKSGPSNTAVKVGEKVTFSASASGEGLTCQWYYKKAGASGWSLWNGHTTQTTSASANASWDGMQVFCLFTDKYGDTVSSGCATVYILTD